MWRNFQFRPCKSCLGKCKRKHSSVSCVNLPQDTTDVSWWAMTGVALLLGSLLFIILRWWWSWSCWTALIHVCLLVSCLTYYFVVLPKSSHRVTLSPKAPYSLLNTLAWLAHWNRGIIARSWVWCCLSVASSIWFLSFCLEEDIKEVITENFRWRCWSLCDLCVANFALHLEICPVWQCFHILKWKNVLIWAAYILFNKCSRMILLTLTIFFFLQQLLSSEQIQEVKWCCLLTLPIIRILRKWSCRMLLSR